MCNHPTPVPGTSGGCRGAAACKVSYGAPWLTLHAATPLQPPALFGTGVECLQITRICLHVQLSFNHPCMQVICRPATPLPAAARHACEAMRASRADRHAAVPLVAPGMVPLARDECTQPLCTHPSPLAACCSALLSRTAVMSSACAAWLAQAKPSHTSTGQKVCVCDGLTAYARM